jgi:peptidoglycan/xylan/chitin deacetylase (PgdA/CDA1 family)
VRAILTYHSIDASGSPISVDRKAFEGHADWLASGRVATATLEDVAFDRCGSDAVSVTFDDGVETFASEAWPILREREIPVTLFVVTEAVGRTNRWSDDRAHGIPELRLLDWDELGKLVNEGVSIGSHTRTHKRLTEADGDALRDELQGSRETIRRRLGVEAESLAYPYGAVDAKVVRAAQDVYDIACTTELRALAAADAPALLPRIETYYLRRRDSLQSWGTTRFKRYLAARAWLRSLRRY